MKCNSPDHVIVHDAARPLITADIVREVVDKLLRGSVCVSTSVEVVDGFMDNGAPLSKIGKRLTQTPEGFHYATLVAAHRTALRAGKDYRDDCCMLYDQCGLKPDIVEGIYLNSKLTFAKDLENAEGVMRFHSLCLTTIPNLAGKNILVFGGSGGIGSACIKQLKALGATVHAPTHREFDLSHSNYFDLNGYDGVIHTAGAYRNSEQILSVNTMSCYELLMSAAKQEWKGNIIFLSSSSATYGRKGIALYSASKAALNSLIESMHHELAEKGIFINAVAPAKVDTAMAHGMHPMLDGEELLAPDFVAERVLRYLDTRVHGHVVYLRIGMNRR